MDRNIDIWLQLQTACEEVARCLGCTVEGVAAESVRDVLHSQASSVLQDRQHIQQQVGIIVNVMDLWVVNVVLALCS